MKRLIELTAVFSAFCLVAGIATAGLEPDAKQVAPGPEPTCDFSWTGFYIGARLGGGFGNSELTAHGEPVGRFTIVPDDQDLDPDGFIGGGQVGFNWQMGRFLVLGAEADFLGGDLSANTAGAHSVPQLFPFVSDVPLHARQDINWFGTVRGRVGFAPWCKWLVYGTGGFAYADVDDSVEFDLRSSGGNSTYPASHSGTQTGWTAGGGIEFAVSQHWTIKAEYLYIDVGDRTAIGNPIPANPPFQVRYNWDAQFHTFTAGVNFKF